MPAYDASLFDPPAPLTRITLRRFGVKRDQLKARLSSARSQANGSQAR